MMSDLEIAQAASYMPLDQVAAKLGLSPDHLEMYGSHKAKLSHIPKSDHQGKLVLVTAMSPTPAGEGKSTVTIGLGDGLNRLGKKAVIALREPSLGPVMGLKGGATGGGHAQVIPMEDINLHFTGDLHALTSANNTLAALIDNHLHQGNALGLDPSTIAWKRALDINDRALRQITIGLGGKANGVTREDGFDITVASELMAILCLSQSLTDLEERIGRIYIGDSYQGQALHVADLGCQGAITVLLKDAFKPNLVQTLEASPALVHGGPFANIAHGCSSLVATRTALSLGEFVVTEAGFGADLGALKFLEIKAPLLGKGPDVIVLVATIRSLKYHGGQKLTDLTQPDLPSLQKGLGNLDRHINNLQSYGIPLVVALNHFLHDSQEEIDCVTQFCGDLGVPCHLTRVWEQGGEGAIDLAQTVLALSQEAIPTFAPQLEGLSVKDQVHKLAVDFLGANQVVWSSQAKKDLRTLTKRGLDQLPICLAKTQYSFSDDAKALGAPKDFPLHIRSLSLKEGAGFVVVLTGQVLTMPGLPKHPAALDITISDQGQISGLF